MAPSPPLPRLSARPRPSSTRHVFCRRRCDVNGFGSPSHEPVDGPRPVRRDRSDCLGCQSFLTTKPSSVPMFCRGLSLPLSPHITHSAAVIQSSSHAIMSTGGPVRPPPRSLPPFLPPVSIPQLSRLSSAPSPSLRRHQCSGSPNRAEFATGRTERQRGRKNYKMCPPLRCNGGAVVLRPSRWPLTI